MATPPRYQQIAAQLRAEILTGRLRPSDKLPTEKQLLEIFNCSRDTIRDATAVLVNEGLIERVAGRTGGMVVRERTVLTFHASYAERPAGYPEADAWFADVREQGLEPSQQFECKMVALTEEQARLLHVDGPQDAVLRRCIRSVNGKPSSIQDSFYPAWLAEEMPALRSAGDIPQGTTRLLAEHGHVQIGYLDTVAARMALPAEAEILRLGSGTPVLLKTRIACTAERVVRLTVEVMAADANQVEYEVGDIALIRRPTE